MQKKGIDISHHQGDIDFNSLKGNIDFAMVRTSYGSFYEDKKYKQNNKKYNLDLDTKELYKKKVIMNYLYMWDSNNIKNSNDIKELFKC